MAARAAEVRKHYVNDAKCTELGWICVPLAVESYGAWGRGGLGFRSSSQHPSSFPGFISTSVLATSTNHHFFHSLGADYVYVNVRHINR